MSPSTKADDRQARIEAALKAIEKSNGLKFQRMGDKVNVLYPHIPIGVFGIDHDVIGIGGVPKGRIVEIIGPASSGKTTSALQTVATVQRSGEYAAFVDAEHALDPTYASQLGVDVDNLYVAQPDYGEQAAQAVIDLVDTASVGIVVVDSVAALTPRVELEGDMGDAHVGLQARMMGQLLRKLTGRCSQTKTTVIFLNQIREKIGVTFGSNETTPGGRALPFYASLRLDVRRVAQVKEGDVNAGNQTRVKAIKNKMSPPFRQCDVRLMFGEGMDDAQSLAQYAIKNGVWVQKASSYTFDGHTIVGKDNVAEFLKGDADGYAATFAATLRAMGKSDEYIKAVAP